MVAFVESAERTLSSAIVVPAAPEQTWRTLTDFSNMVAASPELLAMKPLKPGGLRPGQWYLGLNRRGMVAWPTRSVIVEVVPGERLVWDTISSGARWTYELAAEGSGTRVTETRSVPNGLSRTARLFAATFLGGSERHADQLAGDVSTTLTNLQRIVEKAV